MMDGLISLKIMKQFCIIFTFICTLFVGEAWAQTMVKGVVKGNDSRALGGVSIRLENPKRDLGKTGEDGRFVISVPNSGVMVFSYQGYRTEKYTIVAGKKECNP